MRWSSLLSFVVLVGVLPASSRADEGATDLTRLGVRTEQLAQLTARFLGEARRDGDATQTQCLDRKLTEVHALLRQTWYRSESGLAPSAALDERYARLRREVHACVGIVLRDGTRGPRARTRVEAYVPSERFDDPTRVPTSEAASTVVPPG
ncbi:MAG: hypothetical protein H6722_30305 [Sandaracinus sp.]|nr:hypothetical protein [Sandaracinus sp.]